MFSKVNFSQWVEVTVQNSFLCFWSEVIRFFFVSVCVVPIDIKKALLQYFLYNMLADMLISSDSVDAISEFSEWDFVTSNSYVRFWLSLSREHANECSFIMHKIKFTYRIGIVHQFIWEWDENDVTRVDVIYFEYGYVLFPLLNVWLNWMWDHAHIRFIMDTLNMARIKYDPLINSHRQQRIFINMHILFMQLT